MGLGMIGAVGTAKAQGLDSLVSPGALSDVHSELTGLTNCTGCHAPGQGIGDDKCLACHQELTARIREGRGFHRGKTSDCATCHIEHQGESFDLLRWDRATFDHEETGYPLVGLHLAIASCDECHRPPNAPSRAKSESFLLNDGRCVACHTDVHQERLGADCERCHALDVKFDDIDFDHGRTSFSLVGAHRRVACESCHPNQRWNGLRFSTCTDCHQDPHRPALGSNCRQCHNESSWNVGSFDHEKTRYPLTGMHRNLSCQSCHRDQGYRGIAFATCRDCHQDGTHLGQFQEDCGSCHVVEGFERLRFDHDASRYPLVGKHETVECEECHFVATDSLFPAGVGSAVVYRPLEIHCRACHEDYHYQQFEQSCDSCHVIAGFDPQHLLFDHDRDSRYRLSGKHVGLACEQCHHEEEGLFPAGRGSTIRYRPISDECGGCHGNVHDRAWWTTSTNHLQTDCTLCHSVHSFTESSFDHERTRFPLTGAHLPLDCDYCHEFAVSNNRSFLLFQELGRDCLDCHASPHLKGMERCMECHRTTTWRVGG